jgi:hypothetical protein
VGSGAGYDDVPVLIIIGVVLEVGTLVVATPEFVALSRHGGLREQSPRERRPPKIPLISEFRDP